jgi:predicted DNA-binding ribbon-helix-helix protein
MSSETAWATMDRLEAGARKRKISMVIAGRKTSVRLEELFWHRLKMMAEDRHVTLSRLVNCLDGKKPHHIKNLTSVLRVHCLLEALKNPGASSGAPGRRQDRAG